MEKSNLTTLIYGKKSFQKDSRIYLREEDFQIPLGKYSLGFPVKELKATYTDYD